MPQNLADYLQVRASVDLPAGMAMTKDVSAQHFC